MCKRRVGVLVLWMRRKAPYVPTGLTHHLPLCGLRLNFLVLRISAFADASSGVRVLEKLAAPPSDPAFVDFHQVAQLLDEYRASRLYLAVAVVDALGTLCTISTTIDHNSLNRFSCRTKQSASVGRTFAQNFLRHACAQDQGPAGTCQAAAISDE